MPVTKEQAERLASLAADCRPIGARRWDKAETIAAIGKLKHLALADVLLAVIRCADDAKANSPFAVTNLQSPHWRERASDRPKPVEPYDPGVTCHTCGQPEPRCRLNPHSGHEFESVIDYARRTDLGKKPKETTA